MDLCTLIDRLPGDLDDRLCIFAAKPWSSNSVAIAVELSDESKPPEDVVQQGLAYFLEVHVAKEVLRVFGDRRPSQAEKQNLLLYYAENDAYPEWVYR